MRGNGLSWATDAAVLMAWVGGGSAAGDTLRVPEDYPTIQAAIDAAAESGDEILVGPGIYTEQLVIFQKEVAIRSVDGAEATILDGEGAHRIAELNGLDFEATVELEGFTVRGGRHDTGGAVLIEWGRLIARHCRFTANTATFGGAIYGDEAILLALYDCTVDHNVAVDRGGAVNVRYGEQVILERCVVEWNQGDAAIHNQYIWDLTVRNCTFRNNTGAGLNSGYEDDVLIEDCIFEDNHNPGGHGGGLYLDFEAVVTMQRCIVRRNTARYGAGIGSYAHPLNIIDCVIEDNIAEVGGGGISWDTGAADFVRCVIRNNQAGISGGGIYGIEGSYGDHSFLIDSLVAGNEAPSGAQIGLNGNEYGDALTVQTSVVEGGLPGVHIEPGWQVTWEDTSNIQDMSVAFGTLITGGILKLTASDDQRVQVRSQFGFTASEPNIVDLRIGAISPVPDPELIDLTFEGRLNQSGGSGRLRLRNWTTGNLFTVRPFAIGTAEIVELAENIDATHFARPGDGRIDVSVFESTLATFTASGFVSHTDRLTVAVR